MRARGWDLQDVVLVEDPGVPLGGAGELTDPGAPSPGESRGPSRARGCLTWLLRNRAVWSLIAAGIAIVVGTSDLVTAAQERERMATLADLPGILLPLDHPVTELWSVGGDDGAMSIGGLRGFRGRLLLTEISGDGEVDVVALDVRTGEEDWRVQAQPAPVTDASGAGTFGGGANCAFPESADDQRASVVACVVTDETFSVAGDDDEAGEAIVGTRAHLLVIDATTGAVISRTSTDPTSSVALLGPDLITGKFAADGRVQVTRAGARDGTPSWTFTSSDPVSTNAFGKRNLWVWASAGFVGVTSQGGVDEAGRLRGGSSWLLSPDGAVAREQVAGPGDDYQSLGVIAGGSMFVESTTTATGARASLLTDADTGRAVTVEATPTGAIPDDGSLGDVILMQSEQNGTLIAYDLATKKPRWTGPGVGAGSVNDGGFPMVLDGRVIRAGFDGSSSLDITSVDGRTGKTVWSTSTKSNQRGSLVTDGRLVLVSRTVSGAGQGSAITALDLTDGRERWEVPIHEEQWLLEIDGHLFGMSGIGLVAYGEP